MAWIVAVSSPVGVVCPDAREGSVVAKIMTAKAGTKDAHEVRCGIIVFRDDMRALTLR